MKSNPLLIKLVPALLFVGLSGSSKAETREHGAGISPDIRSLRPAEQGDETPTDIYQKIAKNLGEAEDQVKDWAKAMGDFNRGDKEVEQSTVHSLLESLGKMPADKLEALRKDLASEKGDLGALRKAVEIYKSLNEKKLEELSELTKSDEEMVSRIAKKVAERKTAEQAFLVRAQKIKAGLKQLDEKLTKDGPSRSEMAALADARSKLRLELEEKIQAGNLHPDTLAAIKSYQNALIAEKEILNKHVRTAVDKEATTYWGHLGDELKRAYLSREGAHNALQAAGMIEGFGTVADIVDSALYATEGKLSDAGVSLASATPILGMAVPAIRGGKNVAKSVGAASDAVRSSRSISASVKDLSQASHREVSDYLVGLARKPSGAQAVARVRTDDAPLYVVNAKHVFGTEAFRQARPKGVGVLPENHVELYRQAVPSTEGGFWARDSQGNIHRFETDKNNQTHWSGATSLMKPGKPKSKPTAENPKPLELKKDVPPDILEKFGF